jgi:hypothetical protein
LRGKRIAHKGEEREMATRTRKQPETALPGEGLVEKAPTAPHKITTVPCDGGNTFYPVEEGTETQKVHDTTFAVNFTCPVCERVFAKLPIKAKDSTTYVFAHGRKAD